MDKRCTICTHPDLAAIDQALRAGVSLRSLAAHYDLSVSALSRHTRHLRRRLAAAADEADQQQQTALLDKLDLLECRLDRIFHKARENAPSTSPWAAFRKPCASLPSEKKSAVPRREFLMPAFRISPATNPILCGYAAT